MVRSAYSLVFITVVFACSPEPDFNIQNHPPHSLSDYYLKEYYEENREQITEQKKQKYTCECGSIIRKCDRARHFKSKKHTDYLANK